jgi:hypothetical protein
MDWHYMGGRALIKTLDGFHESRKALESAIPEIVLQAEK